jgi:hypothetical protein
MVFFAPAGFFCKPVKIGFRVYSMPGSLDSQVMNALGNHNSTVVNTPGNVDRRVGYKYE